MYNTYYSIDIDNVPKGSIEALSEKLKEFMDDIWENSCTNLGGHYYGRWYEWEVDLANLSSEFPEIFITVDGSGEDAYDWWRAYVKDGSIQVTHAKIVYEEYDPAKMREINPPQLGEKPSVGDLL